MELVWAPRPRGTSFGAGRVETADAMGGSDALTTHAVRSKSACQSPSTFTYRVLAFALLGLAMNVHGATRGRREWVLRYDGTFTRTQPQRMARAGLTVTLGLETAHACASAASCLLLLAASVTARRWLSLPALLLTASDLLGDVSDAVVASTLLLLYSGLAPALLYALFAALVIALECYLWSGALRWYEQGLAMQVVQLEQRLRQRTAPTAASSASSVMD